MPKLRAIGLKLRTKNSQKLFSKIVAKTGSVLLRVLKVELMFSVCTDGKKF